MEEKVILVDSKDNEIGSEEKMSAHINAKLHRAFSVFIFNSKKELLLQRRAISKYHSPNLWTNSCCSHPRPGEKTISAAHRRLNEELGFDTELKEVCSFTYTAKFDNDLTEHEFDHVFVGDYNGLIKPDPEEVGDIKWINMEQLVTDVKSNPKNYTEWFKIILSKYLDYLN